MGLSRLATSHGFDLPTVIGLTAAGGAFAGFILHGRRLGSDAIVEINTFSWPGVFAGVAIMGLLGATVFSLFFGLPQFYQDVRFLSPISAGVLMIPYGVGALFAVPITGYLSERIPAQRIVAFGAGLSLFAFTVLYAVGATLWIPALAMLSLITGIGLGSIASPTAATIFRLLPSSLAASGTTMLFIILQLGGAFGVVFLVMIIGDGAWSESIGSVPFLFPVSTTLVIALSTAWLGAERANGPAQSGRLE